MPGADGQKKEEQKQKQKKKKFESRGGAVTKRKRKKKDPPSAYRVSELLRRLRTTHSRLICTYAISR